MSRRKATLPEPAFLDPPKINSVQNKRENQIVDPHSQFLKIFKKPITKELPNVPVEDINNALEAMFDHMPIALQDTLMPGNYKDGKLDSSIEPDYEYYSDEEEDFTSSEDKNNQT